MDLLALGGFGQHCRHADHRLANRWSRGQHVREHGCTCSNAFGELLHLVSDGTYLVDS